MRGRPMLLKLLQIKLYQSNKVVNFFSTPILQVMVTATHVKSEVID